MPDPWKDTGRWHGHDPSDSDPQRRPSRRDRVRAEIERNRRGEYAVPTWVLALALGLFVAGWIALIIFD
jgi:hypothetical protein